MSLPAFGALPSERRGYAETEFGQIHYREMGAGMPVLLIHQAPWCSIQYHRAMPLVAAAGFRAIAPDLPGHGMSDRSGEPSVERYADAIAALASTLGLGDFAIMGHHGGALVAARIAAHYPEQVSALVIDNMPFYSAEQRAARIVGLHDPQTIAPDGSHFTDRWALVRRIGDPTWSDETVHLSLLAYFAAGPWKEDAHRAAPLYDAAADVDAIACPTLAIAGRTDPLFSHAALLADARPDWARAELPGGAGMVFEHTADWWRPIDDFLRGAIATTRPKGDLE